MTDQEIMNNEVDREYRHMVALNELAALKQDKRRLDWMLDANDDQLTNLVEYWTRDGIDAAMEEEQEPTEPHDGDPYKANLEDGL